LYVNQLLSERDSTTLLPVDALCPQCGLCCDGSIFADVKLAKADHPQRLASLGLPIQRQGGRSSFVQPCSSFDGSFCRIYADRPSRCRTFECLVLKQVAAGKLSTEKGLGRIRRARRLAKRVRSLLKRVTREPVTLPLTRAYREAMEQPLEMTGDGANWRGRLMLAMDELMTCLHADFLD
jgi:hypothetical protein